MRFLETVSSELIGFLFLANYRGKTLHIQKEHSVLNSVSDVFFPTASSPPIFTYFFFKFLREFTRPTFWKEKYKTETSSLENFTYLKPKLTGKQ